MLQKNSSCFSVRLRLKRVAALATPVAAIHSPISVRRLKKGKSRDSKGPVRKKVKYPLVSRGLLLLTQTLAKRKLRRSNSPLTSGGGCCVSPYPSWVGERNVTTLCVKETADCCCVRRRQLDLPRRVFLSDGKKQFFSLCLLPAFKQHLHDGLKVHEKFVRQTCVTNANSLKRRCSITIVGNTVFLFLRLLNIVTRNRK